MQCAETGERVNGERDRAPSANDRSHQTIENTSLSLIQDVEPVPKQLPWRPRPAPGAPSYEIRRTSNRLMVGRAILMERPDTRPPPRVRLAYTILRQIERLIRHRHGVCCDTDDGSLYLDAAVPQILVLLDAGRESRSPRD